MLVVQAVAAVQAKQLDGQAEQALATAGEVYPDLQVVQSVVVVQTSQLASAQAVHPEVAMNLVVAQESQVAGRAQEAQIEPESVVAAVFPEQYPQTPVVEFKT
jgi:1,2-phenylacetyl-CoA epoxidase PaaB subunit